ncbi:beta-glucosidase family protein [Nakamurella lactea]|uniref:beta-glucosidase family protein n=1 Tax=Nakamurella lactea TaxID=459515 RepID=UPI0003F7031E|nr:glycoside hydrolase family 3 C-terminal domain-containing protein [Nakamurella lactea]
MTTSTRPWSRRPASTAIGITAAAFLVGGFLPAAASPPAVSTTAAVRAVAAPAVTGDAKVDALLAKMTLDEKLTLLNGVRETATADSQYQAGYLPGIPRLGIPSLRLSDGPPGVITRQDSTGMTSTMGVAATFSQSDAKANGATIGRDARALGQDVVLEPFVNMDRDTSWGRAFNTFGEDPLLTGQTAAAEITGIQAQGVMSQVKHYIAYDGGNNVTVDSQTLHEIYLQPFADAVKAGVSSVMCSYNAVNGYQACANSTILTQILRNELGFKGFVTSDWGANHGTTDLNAGLDLSMPGGSYFTKDKLKAAIGSGSIQVSRVTEAAGRILYEMDLFGLLDGNSKHTVTPETTAKNQRVVLKTAQDAATLLQNKGNILPLSKSSLSSLALIGPGAGQTIATNSGGEAAGGLVDLQVSALTTLRKETKGTGSHIKYAVADDLTGAPVPASALSHNGSPGLLRSTPGSTATQVDRRLNFTTGNNRALAAGSSQSWSGDLTVAKAGNYWLNIQALGGTATLKVDGNTLTTVGGGFGPSARYGVVHPTDGNAPTSTTDHLANGRTLVALTAGPHTLSVDQSPDVSGRPVEVRLNWVTPAQQKKNHAAAVAAAKRAKTAVVFVWATGSGDLSAPLPDGQDQLIADVAAVNPNTVVVLQSNEPIAMPWLSSVKAVLEVYYGGDQAGVAQANVLLGKANPGGRLPFTWPTSLDQEVAHQADHPERSSAGVDADGKLCTSGGRNSTCKTTYSEGLNIGYRFFDATGEKPLYPFGYGLSYAKFKYSGLRTSTASDGGLNVSFRVRNTGKVAGAEVPQLYLRAPDQAPDGVQFAVKALAAYGRIQLAAKQSVTVALHIPVRQLQYWSDASGWTTAVGTRRLEVGPNEQDVALSRTITVRDGSTVSGYAKHN